LFDSSSSESESLGSSSLCKRSSDSFEQDNEVTKKRKYNELHNDHWCKALPFLQQMMMKIVKQYLQEDEFARAKTKYVSWKNLSFDQRYLKLTSEINLPPIFGKSYKGQSTKWNGKKVKAAASSFIQCSYSIIRNEE
jgi:hypothetical protein